VAYARNGQLIGVGAGQQSRVDCVKLVGRKAATWYLRQHPQVQSLPFKANVRKQDRINARVGFCVSFMYTFEYACGDFSANWTYICALCLQ
jgi:AICAR transformylase/IMP cyclohydrolase PurH